MKKIFILAIILSSLTLLAGVWIIYKNNTHKYEDLLWKNYTTKNMTIDGRRLKLIIADEPARFEKGLMFVHKPVDFDGMIFKFPDSQIRHFWNMNTFEDLNLYWYNDGVLLGRSYLPSIDKSKNTVTVASPKEADTVVEVIR